MFRTAIGALPRSLRRANTTQFTTWEQAWRKLFTSQSASQAVRHTRRGAQQAPSLGPAATRGLGSAPRTRFSSGQTVFRAPQRRGFRLSPWRRNKGNGTGAEENLSLSARFRKLSREYGRAAVGVYFLLSICDYPFFFLLVKAVGTERVGEYTQSTGPVLEGQGSTSQVAAANVTFLDRCGRALHRLNNRERRSSTDTAKNSGAVGWN